MMILPSRELMPIVRAALERGQRVRMTVTGGSMFPFLRDGDVVELEPALTLRLGDMVLVQTNSSDVMERYVLHRIVRWVDGAAFLIRGDAQLHCEGPFTPDAVLGRVTTAWRNGRPRNLNHGLWWVAGLIWARTNPLGLSLLQLALPSWQLGRRTQRWLQQFWKQA